MFLPTARQQDVVTTETGEGPGVVAIIGIALVNRVMSTEEYWPELRSGCRVSCPVSSFYRGMK